MCALTYQTDFSFQIFAQYAELIAMGEIDF